MRNVWVVVFALAAACGSGGHDGNGDDGGGGDAGGGSGVTLPAAACQLPGTQDGVRLGFPRIANRAPTTGDVHIKVLFVDFSDAVATQTPQQVMGILSPGAEQFYAAVSAGVACGPQAPDLRSGLPLAADEQADLRLSVEPADLRRPEGLHRGGGA